VGKEGRLVRGVAYGTEMLRHIASLCEADPQRESCGFVVRRGGGKLEVVQIPNVADRYHDADPARFPRTSRDSYLMDARALRRLQDELDSCRGRMLAVWHSHIDAGAYFSAKDRADAVLEGEPVMPDVEYLVLGMRGGVVVEAKRFIYVAGQFAEEDLGTW
jgi:proteasome lid subunit RPN8/RPN11